VTWFILIVAVKIVCGYDLLAVFVIIFHYMLKVNWNNGEYMSCWLLWSGQTTWSRHSNTSVSTDWKDWLCYDWNDWYVMTFDFVRHVLQLILFHDDLFTDWSDSQNHRFNCHFQLNLSYLEQFMNMLSLFMISDVHCCTCILLCSHLLFLMSSSVIYKLTSKRWDNVLSISAAGANTHLLQLLLVTWSLN